MSILEDNGVTLPHSVQVKDRVLAVPSTYGDDLVVWTVAYELTCEILTSLGFIVNEDKSYHNGSFRESCGGDYLAGEDVSSVYFPRFPILGSIGDRVRISTSVQRDSFSDTYLDSLGSLIDLQKRLYYACYPASRFIFELVMEAKPSMTYSPAGTVCSDLWDYDDKSKVSYPPCGQVMSDRIFDWSKGKWVSINRRVEKRPLPTNIDLGRRLGLSPVTRYTIDRVSEFDQRLFNIYKYRSFLKHGPSYEDPLLELLGVTQEPITIDQAYGTPSIKWVLTEK
jgi:hypothetical protein